jgi:TrmH family RNA methyltransferase
MATICVVLREPKHQCNVGFVARAMKNFGLSKLYFSGKTFVPTKEAFDCAAHADDVVRKSKNLGDKPLTEIFDLIIGTTAKPKAKESSPRNSISAAELSLKLGEIRGDAALIFGREDTGLYNDELELCDLVVSIPTGSDYPTLNISHAAAILFYEIASARETLSGEIREAGGAEKDALLKRLGSLLDSIGYPNYKKKVAKRIFRKVIGRAGISAREAHTFAGIFKEADDKIKRNERAD